MTAAKFFSVKELSRLPEQGPEDRLAFQPGVNVVVGPPNTGKTKWLQLLDYLLGNEASAEDALGEDVAQKYDSATATLSVAGEELVVQRRWKEAGSKGKVYLNGTSIPVKEFLHGLMERVGIPIIHYPQGNPYGERTWPELGWRSLYRHMYRRQTLWGDIADRQPESEQHACLLQFVGIAEHFFSEQYGQLVAKEKKVVELQAAKDQFMAVLQEVSKELIKQEDLGVGLTPQSIEAARQRTTAEMDRLHAKKQQLLSTLASQVASSSTLPDGASFDDLGEQLANLQTEHEAVQEALKKADARRNEIASYKASVADELGRMERAQKAGEVLAGLKVTHCPVCDRAIAQPPTTAQQDSCYLCKRPFDQDDQRRLGAQERVAFETEQLKAALSEAIELVGVLNQECQRLAGRRQQIAGEVQRLRSMLRPLRSAAAAVLPPEVGVIDMQIGQLQERLGQLDRVAQSLSRRELLAQQIAECQQQAAALEAEIASQSRAIDFESAGDLLGDGINTYLNSIEQKSPTSWTQQPVSVRLEERRFRFQVGTRKWQTQLGGTLTLFFLIAYHYSLMGLSSKERCHFPGFLVLDFPAELEDGTSIADKENFVLEPFVELFRTPAFGGCQLIATGGAFENLEGAHRNELSRIWK